MEMKSFPLFTSALFVFLYTTSFSQSQITGQIIESNGEAVIFANILLLNPADSSLIKGALSDEEGFFEMEVDPDNDYLVEANMVGYQNAYSGVINVAPNSIKKLEPMVLSEGIALDEVQVVARRPLFEQKIDRLVVNVSNSVTAAGGTALEVLERSPGVVVNRQSNALSLIGKDGVVVMINGKISYQPTAGIVQMLEGMSADNIERIELITTPPAQYDAEGNAGYINIVLKKRTDVGLNGNFSVSAGYGEGPVGSANVNLNYRKNKVNLFGTYSFTLKNQYQEFFNYRKVIFEGNTTESEVTTFRDPSQINHNVRLGLDYEIGKKTIFGVLLGAYDNKWSMDAENEGFTNINNELNSSIKLINDEVNQWRHAGANANLEHKFNEDSKLNVNVDYLIYEDQNPNNYATDFFDQDDMLDRSEDTRSRKYTPINILVAQMDYEKKLNEKIKSQFGIKGAMSTFENDVSVERF